MQLLDVVLGGRDRLIAVKDHVHRISIARHFLLIAARERFAPQTNARLKATCSTVRHVDQTSMWTSPGEICD